MILFTFHQTLDATPDLSNSRHPLLVLKGFYAPTGDFLFKVRLPSVRICLCLQGIQIADIIIYFDSHTISLVWMAYTY